MTEHSTKPDMVNHPSHYKTGGIETIDFLQAKLTSEQFIGFCLGNTLKYIVRHEHKGGIEDLRKARWYLDRILSVYDQFDISKERVTK